MSGVDVSNVYNTVSFYQRRYLQERANAGHVTSQFDCADLCKSNGNSERAIECYGAIIKNPKATVKERGEAIYSQGLIYANTEEQDRAYDCFRNAEKSGHREATLICGKHMLKKNNPTAAAHYFAKIAITGDDEAFHLLENLAESMHDWINHIQQKEVNYNREFHKVVVPFNNSQKLEPVGYKVSKNAEQYLKRCEKVLDMFQQVKTGMYQKTPAMLSPPERPEPTEWR